MAKWKKRGVISRRIQGVWMSGPQHHSMELMLKPFIAMKLMLSYHLSTHHHGLVVTIFLKPEYATDDKVVRYCIAPTGQIVNVTLNNMATVSEQPLQPLLLHKESPAQKPHIALIKSDSGK